MFETTNQEVDRILAAWYDVDMGFMSTDQSLTNHQESTAGFFGSGVSRN
jgi:hypothetical protein